MRDLNSSQTMQGRAGATSGTGVTVIVVRPRWREFGHEPSPTKHLCRDYPSADTACLWDVPSRFIALISINLRLPITRIVAFSDGKNGLL